MQWRRGTMMLSFSLNRVLKSCQYLLSMKQLPRRVSLESDTNESDEECCRRAPNKNSILRLHMSNLHVCTFSLLAFTPEKDFERRFRIPSAPFESRLDGKGKLKLHTDKTWKNSNSHATFICSGSLFRTVNYLIKSMR